MPSSQPDPGRHDITSHAPQHRSRQGAARELARAERLAENGKVAEAIALLHEAVRRGADRYTCLLRIARLHESKKQWSEAVSAAEQAIEADPERLAAREAIITFLLESRDYAAAVAASKALLKLSPRHIPARDALGAAYLGLGDLRAAMRAVQELIRLDPTNPSTRFTKAHIAHNCGDVAAAVEEFERVIALDQDGELAEMSRQTLETLDAMQISHIATLAAEDAVFRAKLLQDSDSAHAERGFCLSETGRDSLRAYVEAELPDIVASCRATLYQ